MNAALEKVRAKVASQKTALPALYGDIDFDLMPERFTDDPKASVAPRLRELDPGKVALIKAYTMLGDVVADAYAALMPKYGFRPLIQMLTKACDEGVEAVLAREQLLHDAAGVGHALLGAVGERVELRGHEVRERHEVVPRVRAEVHGPVALDLEHHRRVARELLRDEVEEGAAGAEPHLHAPLGRQDLEEGAQRLGGVSLDRGRRDRVSAHHRGAAAHGH